VETDAKHAHAAVEISNSRVLSRIMGHELQLLLVAGGQVVLPAEVLQALVAIMEGSQDLNFTRAFKHLRPCVTLVPNLPQT